MVPQDVPQLQLAAAAAEALPRRIASACTRGVIRVPLTVELQLEAQTLPFLPISGP